MLNIVACCLFLVAQKQEKKSVKRIEKNVKG